jgi:hypothetical protein
MCSRPIIDSIHAVVCSGGCVIKQHTSFLVMVISKCNFSEAVRNFVSVSINFG